MEFAAFFPVIAIVLGGFVVGLLVGITGVGAGALTTPMLISGFGVSPTIAVGTDLLFAAITKGSAAWRHHRLGNVHWPILRCLAVGSLAGALVTLAWLRFGQPDTVHLGSIIRQMLAVALVLSAITIPVLPLVMRRQAKRDPHLEDVIAVRSGATLGFGLLLGVIVTLTSIGAGAIGVAVLSLLYTAMPARRIVGTDIVHAIPLAFVAGLGHLGMGNFDYMLLGQLLIGSIPGIALGARLTGIIPDWLLRFALATVLLVAAYLLVGDQVIRFLDVAF